MGESACLLQPFSYASGIPIEAKQGNPIHALGESISFGRYMSESLSWEKWSTFSHNRYVEEAERYAQPGSVAQKKAFFEAHYKRIAAKKAAALLEQANASSNAPHESDFETGVCDNTTHDSQATIFNSQVDAAEQQEAKTWDVKVDAVVSVDEAYNTNVKPVDGADSVTEPEALVGNPVKDDSLNQLENIEEQNTDSGLELSGTPLMEKPLLNKGPNSDQDVPPFMSKKKPALSSLKSSVFHKASKVPSSPAKPRAPIQLRKENSVTPITRKPTIDPMDKKRSTPKSLRALINFSPTKEPDKLTTPVIRKMESSRVAPFSSKTAKDFSTPMRTPIMGSANRVAKHPAATPSSENRRVKTPIAPSASGRKTTGPKWHILSAVCSKSLSACRNKLQSPTLSSPFILRTEERAARRKQKLEEKFNAKDEQKVQLQTKLKEKAETELRKLRQSFCFKARPLPDFYKEREVPKNQIKKISHTHPQSPKLGRKPSASSMKVTISPPPTSSTTKSISKNILKKNGLTPTHSVASLTGITHENTSPNIQQ